MRADMTRPINFVVVHHTVSPAATVGSIRRYHLQNKGWRDIGYHCVIQRDASVHCGRPEDLEGAHTANRARRGTDVGAITRALMPSRNSGNDGSLGIVVCGAFHRLTPTHDQINALVAQISLWCRTYRFDPDYIFGHCDFDTAKSCPGINLFTLLPQIRVAVTRRAGRP